MSFFKIFILSGFIQFKILHCLADSAEINALKTKYYNYFRSNNFRGAISVLNKLIEKDEKDKSYFFKRATANFALLKFKKSIKDLQEVKKLDPKYLPAYEYLGKINAYICDLKKAKEAYKSAPTKNEKEKAVFIEKTKEINSIERLVKDIENVSCRRMESITKIATICGYFPAALRKYAECLWKRNKDKDKEQIIKIATKLIKINKNDIYARKILANTHFEQGRIDFAGKITLNSLKNDPDNKEMAVMHKKIYKTKSLLSRFQSLRNKNQNLRASNALDELLETLPKPSEVFSQYQLESCELNQKIGRNKKAVEVCSAFLKLNKKSATAFKARGMAYMSLKKFNEAEIDFQRALSISPNDHEAQMRRQEASQMAKKAEIKDYYSILKIPRKATQKEIKKAYRKMALLLHPDKVKKGENKTEALNKFKDINEAYKVLSNKSLKRRYDAGENVYREGTGGRRSDFAGGYPFQFRDAQGNTFFMNF